ncbi:hypothetical protein KCTC32516_02066 [Polaribacter huanghezhanensis]|uniref:S41 family peptidase n=1 Tax=Polaribacter huanghezhanensis TaxID=1354726 RepID=UPI002647318D|nr:S41 family peptidase [Polaribacter huanghezhanensis]WKD86690.1 hypothetical protein KCTC32516_02066 [Polaribacter huanghezhanensis]
MKNLYKVLLLVGVSLALYNCTKEDTIPADVEINDFVWKAMNAYYLYQDQIPDLADRRFNNQPVLNSYLRGFASPNELFLNVVYDRPNTDNKSVLLNDYNLIQQPNRRTSFTHGVEYGIVAEPGNTDNVIGFVQYILPNSNASTLSIKRSDFFYAVDNVQLTRDNFNSLLEAAATSYELSMATFDGTTVTPNGTKISLTKTAYTHNPVFISKNIASGGNKIGYLLYNNDFSSNYINDLNTTFLQFKNQGVNELILDLRYNVGGGSFVQNINQIASMITGQFTDQPFAKNRWNSKAQAWFELNQPDSLITKFTNKINNTTPINSLELTDIYIILNGSSSSVELLINSLKSYINVHIINSNTTAGNNTGSITLYNSIDYNSIGKSVNHTVAVQPIVLEFLNNDKVTYADGFTPDLRICDEENTLNLGALGETSDPILNEVLQFINGSPPNPPGICNPNNLALLYNSVRNQRIIDAGIFIKQNLPNTN